MSEIPWELQDDVALRSSSSYPEVFKEIEKIRTKKSSKLWLVLFAVSAVAFAFSISTMSSKFTLPLVIGFSLVVLFHEAGHYLAMKRFGVMNLRIVFIPFLGAVTFGGHLSMPQWQKAVVSLAGPLPGIILGAFLYWLTLQYPQLHLELKVYIFFLIMLNAINLLPMMPLDGAQFLRAISQIRFPIVSAIVRAVTLALMLPISKDLFILVGIFFADSMYKEYKESRIALSIVNEFPNLAKRELDQTVCDAIIIKMELEGYMSRHKHALATRVSDIYERYSNPPLSAKQIAVLTIIYLGALAASYYILAQLDLDLLSFSKRIIGF